MLIGNWNRLAVLIGERGYGKSTWGAYLALRWQREAGAYVIGHSLGGRLPRRLPPELGGHELPIRYHETLDGVRRGIYWHPGKWHILAPPPGRSDGATADDLLQFSHQFSDSVRKSHWERKHWGFWKHNANHEDVDAPPIVVIIDEGVAVKGAGQSRKEKNDWFLEYLISLRHLHIGLIWSMQDPTLRTWQILGQATDLYMFHTHHFYALNALWAAGVPEEEIEKVKSLPRFRHIHYEPARYNWQAAAVETKSDALPATK